MFGFIFVAMTLIAGGLSWMTGWVFWLIVLAGPVGIFCAARSRWIAAGAEWFAANTGWVRIYELTKVELAGSGVSPRLYLTDTAGRVAHAGLREMQANSRLWDLVYNGIIHSIHHRDVELNTAAKAQVVEFDSGRHRE
jgi:hypothetical protein